MCYRDANASALYDHFLLIRLYVLLIYITCHQCQYQQAERAASLLVYQFSTGLQSRYNIAARLLRPHGKQGYSL